MAGQVIYAALCRSVGVHRARHLMVSGDGAEWIPVLVRNWFPDDSFQLDHYHLKVKLRSVAEDPNGPIAWALSGQWRRIERSLTHLVARGRLDPKVARETRAFLELNAGAIWAFRELLAAGALPELCTRGSGVIEHTIDLVVARRMKRQGMRWSREGAHNLLVLRCLLVDPRPGERGGRRWSSDRHPAVNALPEEGDLGLPEHRGGKKKAGAPTAHCGTLLASLDPGVP